jgi:hypothetical protein
LPRPLGIIAAELKSAGAAINNNNNNASLLVGDDVIELSVRIRTAVALGAVPARPAVQLERALVEARGRVKGAMSQVPATMVGDSGMEEGSFPDAMLRREPDLWTGR